MYFAEPDKEEIDEEFKPFISENSVCVYVCVLGGILCDNSVKYSLKWEGFLTKLTLILDLVLWCEDFNFLQCMPPYILCIYFPESAGEFQAAVRPVPCVCPSMETRRLGGSL